jgi:hypothetical protein
VLTGLSTEVILQYKAGTNVEFVIIKCSKLQVNNATQTQRERERERERETSVKVRSFVVTALQSNSIDGEGKMRETGYWGVDEQKVTKR